MELTWQLWRVRYPRHHLEPNRERDPLQFGNQTDVTEHLASQSDGPKAGELVEVRVMQPDGYGSMRWEAIEFTLTLDRPQIEHVLEMLVTELHQPATRNPTP